MKRMAILAVWAWAWAMAGGLAGAQQGEQPKPAPAATSPAATSPAVLLEKGIYNEETAGDLDAAIKVYRQIVGDAKANRKVAAQAQYRLAMCYLKKGDKAKAADELRELLATYSQEKDVADQAQKELAKLTPAADAGPRVIKTTPAGFANDVDPSLDKISVSFDRPMMDKSWSWTGGGETYPERTGEISYDASLTTCTMPVKLQPGKVYWVGVNSPSHRNFKTSDRTPAKWYIILFATRSADGKPMSLPEDLASRAKVINAAATQDPVREAAAQFLAALRDKDLEKMKAWSLGSVRGWLTDEQSQQPGIGKVMGLSTRWLGKIVREMHEEVYKDRPELLTKVADVAVSGDYAAIKVSHPTVQDKYMIFLFTRTVQGWRFAYADDAREPLLAELDKTAPRLKELLGADIPGALSDGRRESSTLGFAGVELLGDFVIAESKKGQMPEGATTVEFLPRFFDGLKATYPGLLLVTPEEEKRFADGQFDNAANKRRAAAAVKVLADHKAALPLFAQFLADRAEKLDGAKLEFAVRLLEAGANKASRSDASESVSPPDKKLKAAEPAPKNADK